MYARLPIVVLIALTLSGGPAGAQAPKAPKAIGPAEAKDHLGEKVTVEMPVKASKKADKKMEFYLDSEEDFRSETNLAIVIKFESLPAFKKAGIEDPAAYYADKTIRVSGVPKREGEFIRIRVTDPKSLSIVKK